MNHIEGDKSSRPFCRKQIHATLLSLPLKYLWPADRCEYDQQSQATPRRQPGSTTRLETSATFRLSRFRPLSTCQARSSSVLEQNGGLCTFLFVAKQACIRIAYTSKRPLLCNARECGDDNKRYTPFLSRNSKPGALVPSARSAVGGLSSQSYLAGAALTVLR